MYLCAPSRVMTAGVLTGAQVFPCTICRKSQKRGSRPGKC